MNAYYRLYIKSIIKLAATLVIKSSSTAKSMNERLVASGVAVNRDDPYSWKYYLNLSGVYHASQTMMRVISLDTLETIDFTQDNLKIHRATRKEYTYGTRYYKDLEAAYPDQEMLIKGIINPIAIDVALSAPDHNILSYDKSLVEPAEQQLIPQLQVFINLYFARFDNQDYGLFEPYYYPGLWVVLSNALFTEILLIRKAACKTDQAHSYHIRQYLLSFSQIGAEFDVMTLKQKLYFYRNIRYLNLNLGRQEIFEELTQKVLTDRGFGLAAYTISHNYEGLENNLVPTIQLDRETLNGIEPAQGSNKKTVGEVLDLESPLAPGNPLVRDDAQARITSNMQHALFDRLKTKVLESNVVDRTDAEPFTLTEVLLNHWIYLSHYHRYTAVVTFTNPANGDVYRLSVKNAFIFYLYCYNRAVDITLQTVPVISANRVRRIPLPSREELESAVDHLKVPGYYLDYLIDTQVPLSTYISIEAFRDAVVEVHKRMLAHREMRHYACDYITEGQLHTVVDRFYQDIRIDLAGGIDYDLWLKDQGIDVSSMGNLEFDTIAKDIFKSATGGDLGNSVGTRQIHAAMMRIMREMSSYSVQYIAQINDSPLKIIDGKFPKLTIPQEVTRQTTPVETPWPVILDTASRETDRAVVDVALIQVAAHVRSERMRQKVPVDAGVVLKGTATHANPIEVHVPSVTLREPAVVDISTLTTNTVTGYLPIGSTALSALVGDTSLVGYEGLTEARRTLLLQL